VPNIDSKSSELLTITKKIQSESFYFMLK